MPSPTPILHHYEASPYAEKIRLMFGRSSLAWQSLLSPVQPPRPNLDPLTGGGYRRIPVLQIGADIYCDSALIADTLATISGCNEIASTAGSDTARALALRAERDVFFCAISSVPPLRVMRTLLGGFGLIGTYKFVTDRSSMMKGATIKPPQGDAARKIVSTFKADLNSVLSSTPFLGGEQPDYTDYCCFHPLWLGSYVSKKGIEPELPSLGRWYEALLNAGHGARSEITQADAFARAREEQPTAVNSTEQHELIGKPAGIAPADYGIKSVEGILVGLSESTATLARETTQFGLVHVHFPRAGYQIVRV